MTFDVRVKPMVRKFLLLYLGNDYQLSMADPYGILLQILIAKKRKNQRGVGSLDRYSVTFAVRANCEVERRKGFAGLTDHSTVQFNNFVELVLKTEFHTLAMAYTESRKHSIQQAVDEFMGKFDLTPDDIDPMSLRRSFLRYRHHYHNQHAALVTHRRRHGLPVA